MVKIQSPVMEMIPADSTSLRSRRPASICHVARTSGLHRRLRRRRRPAWHGEQRERHRHRSLRPGRHVVDRPLIDVAHQIAQHRREEARQFRLRQAAGPDPVQHDWAERSALNVTAQSVRVPLARALARLARPDRDALLLVAWEQLSYDEVARALDIPVGTVRSRLHRARTKIREALAGTPAAVTYEE